MKTTINRIQARLTAVLAAVLFTMTFSAHAQEAIFKPYAFISIQGGAQTTLTDYNNWKLVTPTASASVGVHFTSALGLRLHVNGLWDKGGVSRDDIDVTYKYKYVTTDLDLMVNVIDLINKKSYHSVNVYLIGGAGLNYAWDNENVPAVKRYVSTGDCRARMSHNFRFGTMLDVNVARHWSVNLEVTANSLSNRFNCKTAGYEPNNVGDDWQLTAQVGLTYKFGIRQRIKGGKRDSEAIIVDSSTSDIDAEALSANTNVGLVKTDPEPEPTPMPAEVVVPNNITRNIFFDLRRTDVSATELPKLAEVAAWLKDHPTAKVSVTGYADRGTGTKEINARYAKQRADSVTKLLTKKYGIEAKRITTDSKGDTVQPFSENDKNRVTIVIAE